MYACTYEDVTTSAHSMSQAATSVWFPFPEPPLCTSRLKTKCVYVEAHGLDVNVQEMHVSARTPESDGLPFDIHQADAGRYVQSYHDTALFLCGMQESSLLSARVFLPA